MARPSMQRNGKNALILLDYDGVIVDSAQPVLDETAAFCRMHGLGFT